MSSTLRLDTLATRDNSVSVSVADMLSVLPKAWVTFNGSDGSIRASFNVSSVVKNASGKYTVTLINGIKDSNGCISTNASSTDPHTYAGVIRCDAVMTSSNTIKVSTSGLLDQEPYFNNVALLLHGEGMHLGKTILDSSLRQKAVVPLGDVCTSNVAKYVGSTGIAFDGTGDGLQIASHVDFNTGTGDYTIEMWVRPLAIGSTLTLMSRYTTWSTVVHLYLEIMATGYVRYRAGDNIPVDITGTTLLTAGNWYHVAVTCASGTTRLFVNGILQGSTTGIANISSTATMYIGIENGSSAPFNGYMDEIRFTNGVARYINNFTPSSAPFPDQSTSAYTDMNAVNLVIYR